MPDRAKTLKDAGEIVFHDSSGGRMRILRQGDEDTVWLTQAEMAELFDTRPRYISQHVLSIYDEKELDEDSTCSACLRVHNEGGRRVLRARKAYNLDLVMAVGFRVKSRRGTGFRHWVTAVVQYELKAEFRTRDQHRAD